MKHHLKKSLRRAVTFLRTLFTIGTWPCRVFMIVMFAELVVLTALSPAITWFDALGFFVYGACFMADLLVHLEKAKMKLVHDLLDAYYNLLETYQTIVVEQQDELDALNAPDTDRSPTISVN